MAFGPRARLALIVGVLVAIGVSIFFAVRSDSSQPGGEVALTGTWAITRIDVGPSQQVTVPDGYNAGFSWRAADQTEIPGPGGRPTSVQSGPGFDLWDEDGDTSCTYTREGNTLMLTDALTFGAPLVNPSPLDTAISSAIGHAFTSNKTNKITVANPSHGGMSLTLGEVMFHLIKKN
jgi:hypothetical protein